MRQLSEQGIINCFARSSNYIGDDAAILGTLKNSIISKDLLVADVHFRLRYYTPQDLAYKALAVNISDMAAMGAVPKYIILGLAVPNNISAQYITAFCTALLRQCAAYNIKIIGGDTTTAAQLTISITIIGTAKHPKLRSGAHARDVLAVTGPLGNARAGLLLLEQNPKRQPRNKLCIALLRPKPRLAEGIWLADHTAVTSMMDLSDGLYADLPKLCSAARVGATIALEQVPIDHILRNSKFDPLLTAVTGGEDYELLLTIRPDKFSQLSQQYLHKFNTKLYAIGNITQDKSIAYLQAGQPIRLNLQPFEHFSKHDS